MVWTIFIDACIINALEGANFFNVNVSKFSAAMSYLSQILLEILLAFNLTKNKDMVLKLFTILRYSDIPAM